MSRKKAPPRPEGEIFSRDPAHCSFATVEKFGWLSILVGVSLLMVAMPSSSKERQASWLLRRQPWFYARLVAYGYFWLSERAYREMGDSVPKHAGPDLID